MRAVLLMILIPWMVTVREEPEDEVAKDTAAFMGKWKVVSSEGEGKSASIAFPPETVISFKGDKLCFTDGVVDSGPSKFKLDVKSKPRSIDLRDEKGERKVVRGIYAIEGDSLKLCLSLPGGERPKEFKTAAGDRTVLLVLKREKP